MAQFADEATLWKWRCKIGFQVGRTTAPHSKQGVNIPAKEKEPPIRYPYARPLWEEDASVKVETVWDGDDAEVFRTYVPGRVHDYLYSGSTFSTDIEIQLAQSPDKIKQYVFDRRGSRIAFVGNCDYGDDVSKSVRFATDDGGGGLAVGHLEYMQQVLKLGLVGAIKRSRTQKFFTDHFPMYLGETSCTITIHTQVRLGVILYRILKAFPELD